MKMKTTRSLGSKATAALLALTLSTMMTPAAAFAANDVNEKVAANATAQDYSGEFGNIAPKYGDICIDADAANGHTATVTAKDLTTSENTAITADTTTRGTIDINVNGVTSKQDNGIQARVDGDGTIKVSTGDISSGEQGAGIWTSVDNREVLIPESAITVKAGNVTADGEGVVIRPYMNSTITIETGNVKAKGDGVQVVAENGGEARLTTGDITSDKYGMFIYVSEGSSVNALVTGTLSGAKAPISFFGSFFNNTNNFNLTVWKIQQSNGNIVTELARKQSLEQQALGTDDRPENEPRWDPDSEFTAAESKSNYEKAINYIVKYVNPTAGGTVSVTRANGSSLDSIAGYEFGSAKQDEKILLKVNVEDGYRIAGTFNGEELLEGENGEYYLVIPKGGGVLLTVKLEKDDRASLAGFESDEDAAAETKAVSASAAASNGAAGKGAALASTGDTLPALPLAALTLVTAMALLATAWLARKPLQ